jgi:hypothetical protein
VSKTVVSSTALDTGIALVSLATTVGWLVKIGLELRTATTIAETVARMIRRSRPAIPR